MFCHFLFVPQKGLAAGEMKSHTGRKIIMTSNRLCERKFKDILTSDIAVLFSRQCYDKGEYKCRFMSLATHPCTVCISLIKQR